MKIICSICKKIIGEQKPFKDSSEIRATCTVCLEKAKEQAARFVPYSPPADREDVTLGNGLKGFVWAVKNEKDKLSFGELVIAGKKFCCSKHKRQEFQEYLNGLKDEEIEITLLHSTTCKLDFPSRGRKKKQDLPMVEEPRKDDSVQYNCTFKATKHYVQFAFDDMAERMDEVIEILADAVYKAYKEDCQKDNLSSTIEPKAKDISTS